LICGNPKDARKKGIEKGTVRQGGVGCRRQDELRSKKERKVGGQKKMQTKIKLRKKKNEKGRNQPETKPSAKRGTGGNGEYNNN